MAAPERVILLVRAGCHLCVEAVAVVEQVCVDLGVSWRQVDVDTDPALRTAYTDHVPVTLVDGREHSRWFVDPARLAEVLSVGG